MKQVNIIRFRDIIEMLIEKNYCINMTNDEYSTIMNNCGVFIDNVRFGDANKVSFVESIETISTVIVESENKTIQNNINDIERIAREIMKKVETYFCNELRSLSIAKSESRLIRKQNMLNEQNRKMLLTDIIEVFEEFLEERHIKIHNPEKEGIPDASTIYGLDYGELEETLDYLIRAFFNNASSNATR